IGQVEEEKLCGDLQLADTFGADRSVFSDVISASLRKDCDCDVSFGAGRRVHVLSNATSFGGITTLSQLILDDKVTLLEHNANNLEELTEALRQCPRTTGLEPRSDDYSPSYGSAGVYKEAYVVKTVKYVYPAPSYG
ncbi:unnamed protein product, partial [Ixodes hexagonus]